MLDELCARQRYKHDHLGSSSYRLVMRPLLAGQASVRLDRGRRRARRVCRLARSVGRARDHVDDATAQGAKAQGPLRGRPTQIVRARPSGRGRSSLSSDAFVLSPRRPVARRAIAATSHSTRRTRLRQLHLPVLADGDTPISSSLSLPVRSANSRSLHFLTHVTTTSSLQMPIRRTLRVISQRVGDTPEEQRDLSCRTTAIRSRSPTQPLSGAGVLTRPASRGSSRTSTRLPREPTSIGTRENIADYISLRAVAPLRRGTAAPSPRAVLVAVRARGLLRSSRRRARCVGEVDLSGDRSPRRAAGPWPISP